MDKQNLMKFRKLLLTQKATLLNGSKFHSREDLRILTDDLADESDYASSLTNQQITFAVRGREFSKLRLIEEALQRVENGTYGVCDDCDCEIELSRLERSPSTTLCIFDAEEQERVQATYAKIS